MKKQLTEKELSGVWSFIVESMELTDEQNEAIHHLRPMTQEMFDSILDRCEELGAALDPLFYSMLDEYPNFMVVRANKIEEEIKGVETLPLPEGMAEQMKQNIYAEIRKRFGEDTI